MGEFFALVVIFEIVYATRVNFSFHGHVLSARNIEIARISAETSIPTISGVKKTMPILNPWAHETECISGMSALPETPPSAAFP
jgi:hypothetical protein